MLPSGPDKTSASFNDSLGKDQYHCPLQRVPLGLVPLFSLSEGRGWGGTLRGRGRAGREGRGGASLGTETRLRRPFLCVPRTTTPTTPRGPAAGLGRRERRPLGAVRVRGQTEV